MQYIFLNGFTALADLKVALQKKLFPMALWKVLSTFLRKIPEFMVKSLPVTFRSMSEHGSFDPKGGGQ